MTLLTRIIFNFSFIFFLIIIIFLLPLSFAFNAQTTKAMLNQMDLYDRITPIIAANTANSFSDHNDQLTQLIKDNASVIINPPFIISITENFIDATFNLIFESQSFQDFEINISDIKAKIINLVASSDPDDDSAIIQLDSQIPNTIFLTDLLSLSQDSLDIYSQLILRLVSFYRLSLYISIFTLIFLLIFYIIYLNPSQIIQTISTNLLISGLFFFPSYFIYRFFLLSPAVIEHLIKYFPSTLAKTIFIILLSFINNLSKIYSIIGICLISFSVLTKILLYWKHNYNEK